jgi:hypothetical protein
MPGRLLEPLASADGSPEAVAQLLSNDPPVVADADATTRQQRTLLFGRDHERNRVVENRAIEIVTAWFTAPAGQ